MFAMVVFGREQISGGGQMSGHGGVWVYVYVWMRYDGAPARN